MVKRIHPLFVCLFLFYFICNRIFFFFVTSIPSMQKCLFAYYFYRGSNHLINTLYHITTDCVLWTCTDFQIVFTFFLLPQKNLILDFFFALADIECVKLKWTERLTWVEKIAEVKRTGSIHNTLTNSVNQSMKLNCQKA